MEETIMITGQIKNKVDKIWTDIWGGGITNPLTVIEQLTYLMFIRSLDEKELRERLKETPFDKLPRMLCAYPLTVTGVRSFDQAQITQGGIDPSDFDPIDMQHRHLHGLHACGEILNVDGDCGGYNLQFAFASGILAAEAN